MKLRYQTGPATIVQLGIMLLLNVINVLVSIVSSCAHHDSCVENLVVNLLFLLVLALWLLFIAAVGYMAEHRRSRKFAMVLLGAETLIAVATLSNIRHYPNLLGLITSVIDFAMAVWVIVLAYRLFKAIKLTPVTHQAPAGQRPRKRVKA